MYRFAYGVAIWASVISACKDKTPGAPRPPVNQPPVATITPGGPIAVLHGATLTLDGSQSVDPDGSIASYAWTLPTGFAASDFSLVAAEVDTATLAMTMPLLVPPLPPTLPLLFGLRVTDDDGATAQASVSVTVLSSQAPVVVISPLGPVEVRIDTTQLLDGSGSFDPDGSIASFAWTLPAGYAPADLDLASTDLAQDHLLFTAPATVPAEPNLIFTLSVTDNTSGSGSASVTVVVVSNEAPVAVVNPPEPRRVLPGDILTLDASGSSDDGAIVGFAWSLPAGYDATALGINPTDLTSATLTFTGPPVTADTELVFELTLTDDEGRTTIVEVRVLVDFDDPPVAVITPAGPLSVGHGRVVQLLGVESFDPDGTPLTYAWSLPPATAPGDFGISAAELDDAGLILVMPDQVAAGLVFELTVTDAGGVGKSHSASVTVDLVNSAPEVRLFGDPALTQTIGFARGIWQVLDFSESVDADGDVLTLAYAGNIGDGTCAGFVNFWETGLAGNLSFSGDPPVGCTAPYLLTVTANDGLADSAVMSIEATLTNAAPEALLSGSATLAPGASATYDAAGSSDPDPGDTLSYAWQARSVSDPTVDCSADWGLVDANQANRSVTAPVSASNPECAAAVLVVVTVTDNHGLSDLAGVDVLVTTTSAARTMVTDDITIAQGASAVKYLYPAPPVPGTSTVSYLWTRTLEAGPPTCALTHLIISATGLAGNDDTNGRTRRRLTAVAGEVGCVFRVTVQATIDGGAEVVTSAFLVTSVNENPVVVVEQARPTAPGVWAVTLPPIGTPVVRWRATDPNGWAPALAYTVTGDIGGLTCSPTCAGTLTGAGSNPVSLTFAAPPAPGASFVWTIDAFDGAAHTLAEVHLDIEPCLYVRAGVSVGGDGTFANPFASVQTALDTALGTAGTNVCLIEGVFEEKVVMRASVTNTPSLSGGFSAADGTPLLVNRGGASVLRAVDAQGVSFAPGADNLIEYLVVEQPATLFTAGRTAAMTIRDASPELFQVTVRGGAGDPAIGVDIASTGLATEPWLGQCVVVGSARAVADRVIGVAVSRSAGLVRPVLMDTAVAIGDGSGVGTAVQIDAGADAILDQTRLSDCSATCAFAAVIGVDAISGSAAASFSLTRSTVTLSGAASAQDAFGVRLAATERVEIRESTISGWVGQRYAVGLADGLVHSDGTLAPGNSTDLVIADNVELNGLGPWDAMSRCSGTRLAAGVLLVGTDGVQIYDNGASAWQGLQGGRANFAFDPTVERVPPSAPGLWLVGVQHADIAGNIISSGALIGADSCPKPTPFPATRAFQDGREGWPGQAPGHATTALTMDGNAILCSFVAENAMGVYTTCIAVDLQASLDALLTNNIISSYNTNFNIAVRATEVTGAELTNNYVEADFMRGGAMVPPWSVFKWLVLAEQVAAGGLALHNNLFYLHRDDPEDNPNERIALREVLATGASSALAAFNHNLLYVEGDLLTSAGAPPYARLIGTSTVDYPAATINAIPGVGLGTGNLVAEPLLVGDEWDKPGVRLDANPSNPALGAADGTYAPDHDIDKDPRSGGAIDVGHDEVL